MAGLIQGPEGPCSLREKQQQEQKQERRLAWLRFYFPAHDDGTVMNGAPERFGLGLGERSGFRPMPTLTTMELS